MAKRNISRAVPGILALLTILALCFALTAFLALYPQADGLNVEEKEGATLDYSHADQGYVMVMHAKSSKKLKLSVSLGKNKYIYDLTADGQYDTFSLPFGDGRYTLEIYRQVSGNRYTTEASFGLDVAITDETLPFLYPNQYVWYTSESAAVAKADELCEGLTTDEEKLEAIRDFVVSNIVYDYQRAETVKSGYIPSIDDVLDEKKGICFDYSCLTACMLRTQGVPTELVIGYADTYYHAWNNVLLEGEWQRVDTTVEANDMKVAKYTEERIY